jgi:hypothetical protein
MVEYMQAYVVPINRKGSLFPQSVEQGYNVMKEMQQVHRHVFGGSSLEVPIDP